jgi:hypothetical protein
MQRRALNAALFVLCLPGAGAAERWQAMSGAEITEALTRQELHYARGAWQRFNASGRTLYHAGTDSWGYWAVRGDQYCSQWPPNPLWTCYDMARQGARFRFTDAYGEVSIGLRKSGQGE